jgi:hypothetical protein
LGSAEQVPAPQLAWPAAALPFFGAFFAVAFGVAVVAVVEAVDVSVAAGVAAAGVVAAGVAAAVDGVADVVVAAAGVGEAAGAVVLAESVVGAVPFAGEFAGGGLPLAQPTMALVPSAARVAEMCERERLGRMTVTPLGASVNACFCERVLLGIACFLESSFLVRIDGIVPHVEAGVACKAKVTSAVFATFVPSRLKAFSLRIPRELRGLTSCSSRTTCNGVFVTISSPLGFDVAAAPEG